MRAWRSWCDQELRHSGKNQYGYWKEGWELAQLLPRSLVDLPGLFRQLLQQHSGADAQILSLQTAWHQGFRNIIHLCEWLDRILLEQYTLAQIQQVVTECKIHGSRLSFLIQDSIRSSNYWAKFEFNVAFMRHYLLFALPCTTTESRSLFKQNSLKLTAIASTRRSQSTSCVSLLSSQS
jgi:hypothetical protein